MDSKIVDYFIYKAHEYVIISVQMFDLIIMI